MTAANSVIWVQRYEDLRAQSLGSFPTLQPEGWGLALLVQQGVQGWMRAWQDPLCASRVEPRQAPAGPGALPQSSETTLLLANMAMRSLALSL